MTTYPVSHIKVYYPLCIQGPLVSHIPIVTGPLDAAVLALSRSPSSLTSSWGSTDKWVIHNILYELRYIKNTNMNNSTLYKYIGILHPTNVLTQHKSRMDIASN